jgi:hypothetical protein
MDITNEIAERYKKMSNSELLEVLQNPSHYQQTALSIARSEFALRQLTETEIQEAKQVLLTKKLKQEKQNGKTEAVKNKITDAGYTLYDTINPIQTTAPTAEKLIRLIALVFTGLTFYKVIADLDLFIRILKGNSHERFAYTLNLFPLLVELIAILLFWFRKQSGWIVLAFFCSYSLVELFYGLYYSISLQFKESNFIHFFPAPSPIAYIMAILFYTGTLFVMKREDLREVYKISKSKIQGPLIAGVLTGILFLFMQLFN